MKRVKNLIKLTNLNSEHLNEKELSHAIGGRCVCMCYYAECGGSSDADNDQANLDGKGLKSVVPRNQAHWA